MRSFFRGLMGCVVISAVALILFPVFAQAKQGSHKSPISMIKQLATSTAIYVSDFDDRLPLNLRGTDPYIKQGYSLPITYNAHIASANVKSVVYPSKTVLIYRGSNERIFNSPGIAFVDTSVKSMKRGQLISWNAAGSRMEPVRVVGPDVR